LRYGRPHLFALEALGRYIGAHVRNVSTRFLAAGKLIMEKFAFGGFLLAGFFAVAAVSDPSNDDLFGNFSFKRVLNHSIYIGDGKRAIPREVEPLKSGFRCGNWVAIPSLTTRRDCISDSKGFIKVIPRTAEPDWNTFCCTKVVAGSDTETMATWRRVFIWIGFPANPGLLGIMFVFLLEAVVALVFFIFAFGISIVIFVPIASALTLWRMASALMRLTWVVLRTFRQLKVAEWTPPPLDEADVLLIHLSDLHISSSVPYELRVNPLEYSGNIDEVNAIGLKQRCEALLHAALEKDPRAIALTGDLTDTGDDSEWKQLIGIAMDAFKLKPGVEVLAVPGNHDVNLNAGERPDVSGQNRANRKWLAGRHLSDLRRKVSSGVSIEEQLLPFTAQLNFNGRVFNVIGVDSCRYESRFILSNAIGKLGRDQLNIIESQLLSCKGPLVVLMHHHLALPARRISLLHPITSATELLKLPVDVRPLMKMLLNYSRLPGNLVLVLHGHQHEELRYRVSDRKGGLVSISGLASSTLGALVPTSPGQNLRLDGIPRFACVGFDNRSGWLIDLKRGVAS